MKDLNIYMKNEAFLSIVDDKLCVDRTVFELHELREVKQYFQENGYESSQFYPGKESDIDKLHSIIEKMGELSPECRDHDVESYYLN
jgi:hypothetical protein